MSPSHRQSTRESSVVPGASSFSTTVLGFSQNPIADDRWENGTLSWTLIEREYPTLSVFSQTSPFPLPQPVPSGTIPKLMNIAQVTMQNRPGTSDAQSGSLLEDGAAGDPVSLLGAIMIANNSVGNAQTIQGVGYGDAASAQLNYTLNKVPRVCLYPYPPHHCFVQRKP